MKNEIYDATPEPEYQIVLDLDGRRDEAWADDWAGALLAARTLAEDRATSYGSSRRLRRGVLIIRSGRYDDHLTRLARHLARGLEA